ncbi:MAG: RHS repeat-associated core domain-containing protein [Bryobacteraceae bacterium]
MNITRISTAFMLAGATAGSLFAVYSYYKVDNFGSVDTAYWQLNGSLSAGGILTGSGNGGSLIAKTGPPTSPGEYEINSGLTLATGGGIYVHYIRATQDARILPATGTYYSVEFSPTMQANGTCTATLVANKRASGVVTQVGYTTTGCHTGMEFRTIYSNGKLNTYIDRASVLLVVDNAITSGNPGVGVSNAPSGSGFDYAWLGAKDTAAPQNVSSQTMSVMPLPGQINLQWAEPSDNPSGTGVGVAYYWVYRRVSPSGSWDPIPQQPRTPELTDSAVTAGVTYDYSITPMDYHWNVGNATIVTVTAPATGTADPLQTGVRPTGSYWGAMGESIDTRSGNLNFTMPLLRAQGRGGSGVTVALNYNSQVWRRYSNVDWKMGRDAGYGFGWRLLVGSITPYWATYYNLHHYVFTDSTGAEYILDQSSGGVWTSKQSVYVSYDSNIHRLYFNDGSFWEMNVVSTGAENDSGTQYPSMIQDANGNQILFRYLTGVNAPFSNSSGRIAEIEDVRAVSIPGGYRTYGLVYDGQNRLTSINNDIQTAENYTFTYQGVTTLTAPFTSGAGFGGASVLKDVTNSLGLKHQFEYGTNSAGELSKVIYPYGGEIRWEYQTFTATGGNNVREVRWRRLKPDPLSGTLWNYEFTWDFAGDAARSIHAWKAVIDASLAARRVWTFQQSSSAPDLGLATKVEWQAWTSGTVRRRQEMTWDVDAAQRPYIGQVLTTLEPGASQKQSKVTQVLDAYGNLTSRAIYDHGTGTTPAATATKTYTNTYETGSAYTSRYLRNLLKTATLAGVDGPFTLVNITYDNYTGGTTLEPRTGLQQHDSANYGTGFVYRGNPTSITRLGIESTVKYDITGAVFKATQGPLTIEYTPDPTHNNTVPSVIKPNGDTTKQETFTYSPFLGVEDRVGPNTATSEIVYDAYARPESSTSQHGATTTYTYSAAGSYPAWTRSASTYTSSAGTINRFAKTYYDGFGRTVKTETGSGPSTVVSTVETQYGPCACSAMGKMKQTSQPYAPGGSVFWTVYAYDPLGRTTQVTQPSSAGNTVYGYYSTVGADEVKVTDPAGKWKTFKSNALGELVQVTEPNPAGGTWNTTYAYNALGKLKTVTMVRPTGTQTRSFAYNSLGQMTSTTNPETGTVNYTYTSNGQVATKIDAKNQKVVYGYDPYLRLTTIARHPVSTGAADPNQATTLVYDTSEPGDGSGAGRLTQAIQVALDETGANPITFRETFGYTAGGLMNKKRLFVTKWTGSSSGFQTVSLEANRSYDSGGQMISDIYPVPAGTGPTYTFSYDALGRYTAMSQTGVGAVVSGVQYNAAGQMTQMTWDGWTETRQYNDLNQLKKITIPSVADWEYVFPATQNNGRITQMKDLITGENVTYAYDALNRLISAVASGTGTWGLSFGYDGFGNKLTQAVTQGTGPTHSFTVNASTNRLNGFTYDSNGNQLPTASGTYDVENRLRQYQSGGEVYGYAADNRRVWKHKPGVGNEITFWGIGGSRVATFNLQQTTTLPYLTLTETARNVWFGGKLIRTGAVGAQASVVVDRLGSVRVSKVGSTVERLDYWPYGEEKPSTTTQEREKFATYTRDATGLDYADQRYFGSTMGRFLTPDPAGESSSSIGNQYSYSHDEPIGMTDSSGLAPASIEDSWGAGCVKYFDAPGVEGDASDPCPPGYLWVTTGGAGGRIMNDGRLAQIRNTFEALSEVIEDWDYADEQGRRFNVTLTPEATQSLLRSGFLAVGAGGALILTGAALPEIAVVVTVTGAVILTGLTIYAIQHLGQQAIDALRATDKPTTIPYEPGVCEELYRSDMKNCREREYTVECVQRAAENYRRCREGLQRK